MSKLKTLTALFMALSLSGGISLAALASVGGPELNTDDIRGRLKSIGNLYVKIPAPVLIPHTAENLYISYNCLDGRVTGLVKGDVISCEIKEELIVPLDGSGAIAPIDATNVTWQDDNGYQYILVTRGIAKVDGAGIAKFFAGEALTDPEYYEGNAGRLQTNNPDLMYLNNVLVILEGQGVTAPAEDGSTIVDYKLLVFDDDRNLFPNDDFSSDD